VSGQLDGKTAIVTGAAIGIGKAIAFALAGDGARVVVNHLNTPELAEAVVAQITRDGGEAIAVAADVGKRAEYTAMVDVTVDRFGSWDILVNNAGVALVKPFGEVTEEEFDNSFQVNVKGCFNGCQLALMRMADGGRIVNISSSTTGLMLPGYGVYDATKGAIEAMSHVISKDFGPRGITVNVVSPAPPKRRPTAPARVRRSSPAWKRCRPSAVSAGRRRSPPWSPSWPATAAIG
jgi:3-oxoacyl-[acyl-carrier protein] reductase